MPVWREERELAREGEPATPRTKRTTGAAAALTVLCLSASACGTIAPSPSEQPLSSSSPTAPRSLIEADQARRAGLDFAAAEGAYRTFSAEYDLIAYAGGTKQPSSTLKQCAGGSLLRAAVRSLRLVGDEWKVWRYANHRTVTSCHT